MKKTALIVLLVVFGVSFSSVCFADFFGKGYVRGYTKKNGTYVAPHYRSKPNHTVRDNWSYKGNVSPYTGKRGTRTYGNRPTYRAPTPYRPRHQHRVKPHSHRRSYSNDSLFRY